MPHLSQHRQLLHQQMSALCFPGSAFPADHHTLVSVVRHHGLVRNIGHGEDVWRVGCTLRSDVHLGVLGGEEGVFKTQKHFSNPS